MTENTVTLQQALTELAMASGLDADQLFLYAIEDNIGGRDTGDFSSMGLFADEGRILYALIRAMKPKRVLEIGVHEGCSSTHILHALNANRGGELTSVDIADHVGGLIPNWLRNRHTILRGDAVALVPTLGEFDFVFEDGPHGYSWTRRMLEILYHMQPKAILSHDAVTGRFLPGDFEVLPAFSEVLGTDKYVLPEGSICGLCYWFKESL